MSLALDAQTDIVTTQRIVSDIEIKKQQEQFGILASTDVNDHLIVNINNEGQNPIEVSSIWITNKTLPDQPVKRYTINYDDAFVPSGFLSDVVSSQTLEMIPDTYDIKVVSSFGSIKTVELDMTGGGTSGLRAEMVTDPPDVIIGQNVTIAMLVTNTGTLPVTNVVPNALGYGSSGTIVPPITSPPTPASADLDRGESVLFTWDYLVTGDSGDELTFSSGATGDGPVITNPVSDISILREPTDGGSGGGETQIIVEDLLAKPGIFLTFPAPFGESDHKGVWGINVANPTNRDMKVTKAVISLLSMRAQSTDRMFDAGDCNTETISPPDGSFGNYWSCPSPNQLVWAVPIGTDITIGPYETYSFLAKAEPGTLQGSGTHLEAMVVHASVFTSFGQFGKAGYISSFIHDGDSPIANVFLKNSAAIANNDNIIGSTNGIASGQVVTFYATLVELDAASGSQIDDGAELVVNVPIGWTLDEPSISAPDFSPVVVNHWPDGSSQIIGTLDVGGATLGLTGAGANVERTITFDATAPTLTNGIPKIYVMHVLASGHTDVANFFPIGPLSESIIEVCPTSGCP